MAKQRQPAEYKAVHKAADYYEPLFRARFIRAMKLVQKQTSINELAMLMGNKRQAKDVIPTARIAGALKPSAKVIRDAFMQGGKVGAERLKALG